MDSLRGVIDDLRLVQNGTNDNALLLSFVHAMQCNAPTPVPRRLVMLYTASEKTFLAFRDKTPA